MQVREAYGLPYGLPSRYAWIVPSPRTRWRRGSAAVGLGFRRAAERLRADEDIAPRHPATRLALAEDDGVEDVAVGRLNRRERRRRAASANCRAAPRLPASSPSGRRQRRRAREAGLAVDAGPVATSSWRPPTGWRAACRSGRRRCRRSPRPRPAQAAVGRGDFLSMPRTCSLAGASIAASFARADLDPPS